MAFLLTAGIDSSFAANRYAIATGAWNSTSTWSTTATGSAGASVPGSGDAVYFPKTCTVTLTADAACVSLNFSTAGVSPILTISGNNTLTVTGAISMARPSSGFTSTINVGDGNLLVGSITMSATTTGRNNIINIAGGTLHVAGVITTGTTGCQFNFTGAGTMLVGGSFSSTPTLAMATGCTINYDGGNQTVLGKAYYNLILSGTGNKTMLPATTTITGDLTLTGTASATTVAGLAIGGNLTIGDGCTFTAAGYNLSVAGNTTVGNGTSGSLTISSATGVKTFTGDVAVNPGATWTNTAGNDPLTFGGSLSNLGTFNAGTGVQTFSGSSKTISGIVTIPALTVNGSLQNNGSLTITSALAGSGTLTNGSSGVLNINFSGTPAFTGLSATASGNLVNYTFSGNQTVIPVNYHDLTLSGSNTKSLQSGTTSVGGNLTLGGSAIALAGAGLTISGDVVLGNGTTFTAGSYTHTIVGNWTNNGATFNPGTGTILFTGSSPDKSINGTTPTQTFNNLMLEKGTGILAFGGNTSAIIVGGTLTMTSGNINTGTGTLTLGTGTSTTGTLAYTSGTVVGNFERWINQTGAPVIFPVGTGNYTRSAGVTFSTLTPGSLTARFVESDPGSGGMPLLDNSFSIDAQFTEGFWSLIGGDGLSSTNYSLDLTGTGFSSQPTDENIRIVKRPSGSSTWSLDGSHVAAEAFTARRAGLSGFSEFALARAHPLPLINFTSSAQASSSESGTITITAQLSAVTTRTVTLPFTLTGTASGSGTDYSNTASPLTIPTGSLSAAITLTITGDALDEPNETVVVTMGSPTNATAGATFVHTATITDDDPIPAIAFSTAAQSSTGESGTLTITAQLNAASGQPVTVPFTVTGTATGGTDYSATTSPIILSAGSTTAAITITIAPDALDEPNETVVITMGTPVNASKGAISVHTATITDDDAAPTVSFATASQSSAGESGTLTVTAQLSAASGNIVTVPFTLTGTATFNSDYTITSSPITIAAGSTTGSATITITGDALRESNETVILTLGTPFNAALGSTTVHTATLTDDDPVPTVSFTSVSLSSAGESGTITVTAQLSSPTSFPATIPFSVTGTAAGSGTDYSITASPLSIAAGAATGNITITISADALHEGNETVIVTMGTPVNATIGANTVFTGTITDDDPVPAISFTVASQSSAAESGTLAAVLTLTAISALPVTVEIAVTGSATSGGIDYSIPAGTITIPAGSPGISFPVTIVQDALDEENETVILTMSSPGNATIGSIPGHTVTITDDDPIPSVTFTSATQTNSSESGTMTVTAQLSAVSGQPVTIPFVVSGTAIPAADFNMTDSPIIINPGSLSGTAIITIVSDNANEPSETVILTMGTVTNATPGSITAHTATILDNDPVPTVSFTTGAQSSVSESGTLTVTAQLSAVSSFNITVPFTVSGTSTGSGTDYSITPSPITIFAGSLSESAVISITEDVLYEPNETVILTMGTPTHATAGATTVHVATITNDDSVPTVSFTAGSQISANESGTIAITAQLSAPSSVAVTVPFTVSGSATGSGTDYTLTASPIIIPAGSTSASATLSIIPDILDETNETVILTMGIPVNAATGPTTVHTAYITDDDGTPTATFSSGSQTSSAESGTMSVTVQLSNATMQTVSIPFTLGGSAGNGTDYSCSASPVTINAGATTGTINISIISDNLDEANESVILTMGTPTNATAGAITGHTVTIADDDNAPSVSFTTTSQTNAGESGTMTITAQLSALSGQPVIMAFSVGGTATPTTDFTLTTSPITIPAGSGSGSITIAVVNDVIDEPNETVVITMGTLTNATAGVNTMHTGTINDNDATPTVSFTTAGQTNAAETGTMTVTAQLSAVSGQAVTVNYTVTGTATINGDYVITPSPLTIAAGSSSATISVTITEDLLDEINETIIITLGAPVNATIGATSVHTLTINDNDATPTVAFTTSAQTSTMETGTLSITAQLSTASGQVVTVTFTIGGTATGGGTDYTLTPSPIAIPAGSTTGSATISITSDALSESNETVILTMGTPTNATAVSPSIHTATIMDDDAPAGSIAVNRQYPEYGYTAQQLVENVLVKGCLKASNITFRGTAVQIGHFTRGTSSFEIDEGIILSTGKVSEAEGPNYEYNTTTLNGSAGDTQLNSAAGITSYDAAVLEFDFVPAGDKLEFNYIFASEEYLESVGQTYNDAFAFFLSGPGIGDGTVNTAVNIALIPNTNTPVSINNVHGQGYNSVSNYPAGLQSWMTYASIFGHSFTGGTSGPWTISPTVNTAQPAVNGQYYVDNGHFTNRTNGTLTWANGNGGASMEFDGRTTLLAAKHDVVPCQTYHIKLVVADAADQKWDSGVFLEGKSFTSNEIQVENLLSGLSGDKTSMYEGCEGSFIRFSRAAGASTAEDMTLNILISGTAQNGIDYIYTTPDGAIIGDGSFPGTATVPAGQNFADYHYRAKADGMVEGNETIIFKVNNSCPCDVVPTYLEKLITIIDETQILPSSTSIIQCQGSGNPVATITAHLKGGLLLENYEFSLDGGPFQANNVFTLTASRSDGSDLVGSSHRIDVSDTLHCNTITENNIIIPDITVFDPNAGSDIMMCKGQSGVAINGSAAINYSWTSQPPGAIVYLSDRTIANPTVSSSIPVGIYTFTLTGQDQPGPNPICTGTDEMVLTVNPIPNATAIASDYSDCNASSIQLSATPTTGVTYIWNPSVNLSSASVYNPVYMPAVSNYTGQAFTVTVTDGNGCSTIATTPVVEVFPAPVITIGTIVNANCNSSNGSAAVSASSPGTIPSPTFSYLWNAAAGNQTTATATNLAAGTYSVTVTDIIHGCVNTKQVTVGTAPDLTVPTAVCKNITITLDGTGNASITPTDLNNGSSDNCTAAGSLILAVSKSTFNSGNVGANSVTLTVTDASGNSSTCTSTVTVNYPATCGAGGSRTIWLEQFPDADNTQNDPAADWTTSTATNNFSVQSNAMRSTNINGGSWQSKTIDVRSFTNLSIKVDTWETGSLSSTDFIRFEYSINGGAGQPFTNPLTGTYSNDYDGTPAAPVNACTNVTNSNTLAIRVTVRDNSTTGLNHFFDNVKVTGDPATSVSATVTNVTCNGGNNGAINITVTGGVAPYTYSWTTSAGAGLVQGNEDQSGLSAGTYNLVVTDANLVASTTFTYTITQPAADPALNTGLTVSDAYACNPATGNAIFYITNAGNGIRYELKTQAGNSLSPAVSGTGSGSDLTLTLLQANIPTATTVYKIVANSVTGCTSADLADTPVLTVYSTAPPTGAASQNFCASASPRVSNVAVNGSSVIWYTAASGGSVLPATTFLTSGSTYHASQTLNGCESVGRLAVTVVLTPMPTITSFTNGTVCGSGSTTLYATASAGTINWYSQPSGGLSLGTGATFTTPVINSTTTYYVDATNNGCSTASRQQVIATVSPVPSITPGSNPVACNGATSVTFLYSAATGNPNRYSINFNDAAEAVGFVDVVDATLSASITIVTPAAAPAGEYRAALTLKNTANGCTSQPYAITVTLSSNTAISSQPSPPPAICELAGTATISVTATGRNLAYQWYVDGTVPLTESALYSGTASAVLTIANPGASLNGKQYSVKVNGICGPQVTSNPVTLTVTSAPTASLSYPGSPFCGNLGFVQSVVLTGSGAFAGGTFSSTTGLSINPDNGDITPITCTPGTYIVTYTAPASGGCPASAFTTTVVIYPVPALTNALSYSTCSGTGPGIELTSTYPGSYSWTIGTVTGNITGASPSSGSSINQILTNPSQSASGTVQYIVTPVSTTGGCTGTATGITVTVFPSPVVTNQPAVTVCSGNSPEIPLTASSPSSFSWTIGAITGSITGASAGTGSSISQILSNPSSSSSGSVQYLVTPVSVTGLCSGTPFAITVTVNPIPAVTTAATSETCSESATHIELTATTSSHFSWTIGTVSGGISGASPGAGALISQVLTNPSHSASGSVQYLVTPTSNNGACAGSTRTITVTVNPIPALTNATSATICSGTGPGLALLASTPSTFTWSIGAITGSVTGASSGSGSLINQPLTNLSNTEIGTVEYLVTPTSISGSCPGPAFPVTIMVMPAASVTNNLNVSVCSGETTSIPLTSSVASSFSWTLGTITGSITGASSGSGPSISQTLFNPVNSSSGSVQYIVTPTSLDGSCPGTPSLITVTVNPVPAVTNQSSYSVCSGTVPAIALTATTPGSFSWTIGTINGSITGASPGSGPVLNQVLINPSDNIPGSVEYLVTPVSSAGSCQGLPYSITVTVNAKPVSTSPSTATICSGETTNIPLTASASGTFSWTVGTITGGITGASPSTGTSIAQLLTNPGNSSAGTVEYVVTPLSTAGSCSGEPFAVTVTVNPLLPAGVSIVASPAGAVCNGSEVVFTASPINGGSNPAYQWYSGSDPISGATGSVYSTSVLVNGEVISVRMTSDAICSIGSPAVSNQLTMSVIPGANANAGEDIMVCSSQLSVIITGGASASNYSGITWTSSGNGVFTNANSITDAAYTPGSEDIALGSVTIILTAAGNSPCGNAVSEKSLTITKAPTADAGPGLSTCSVSGEFNITAGSSATNYSAISWSSSGNGTFSDSNSLINATYTASAEDIETGSVTLTLSAFGDSPCSVATSTRLLVIHMDGSWTGAVDENWNNVGNWSCNQLPTITTDVFISNGLPNYPVLSSGDAGTCRNLTLESSTSLTVAHNTLRISGAIIANGSFTATEGTIEMKGTTGQEVPANAFTTNTILNLYIDNPSGVTLGGALNVTGIVNAIAGNLSSDGNLTLVSTASQTALIDGAGAGEVLGNVKMQRYLPNGFGYKYFSSPFQGANVGQFAGEVDLNAAFPNFYLFDENRSIDSAGVTKYTNGWSRYTDPDNILAPLSGYAANFGSGTEPKTVELTGIVNNHNLESTLFNNNRTYTKGFNLVGNPYPSPINWDSFNNLLNNNIDKSIYFFNASGDQYSGTYSSYVNGINTGTSDNIIPSMQGFFIHVSDGPEPVTGVLKVANAVRIIDLNPTFKSKKYDDRPILHFSSRFDENSTIPDPFVLYFDPNSTLNYDQATDALKLINTDVMVPNLYAITPDGRKVSIDGIPEPTDSLARIPLGIKTFTDGSVTFMANDIEQLPSFWNIYLLDSLTDRLQDLRFNPVYQFNLTAGENDGRFTLVFSLTDLTGPTEFREKMFTLSRSGNMLIVKSNLPFNTRGTLLVTSMQGQTLLQKEVFEKETVEINPIVSTGIYLITMISGKRTDSEKVLLRRDYE